VRTTLALTSHAASAMRASNRSLIFRNYPQGHTRIVHFLEMAEFFSHNILSSNDMALNTLDEARDNVVVGLKTTERFKLVLSVMTCLEH
jgi:hypothetical protein